MIYNKRIVIRSKQDQYIMRIMRQATWQLLDSLFIVYQISPENQQETLSESLHQHNYIIKGINCILKPSFKQQKTHISPSTHPSSYLVPTRNGLPSPPYSNWNSLSAVFTHAYRDREPTPTPAFMQQPQQELSLTHQSSNRVSSNYQTYIETGLDQKLLSINITKQPKL